MPRAGGGRSRGTEPETAVRIDAEVKRFLRRNGLSLVLAVAFLVLLAGQFVAGRSEHNDDRAKQGEPPLGFAEYATSPHFVEATAENWESEFLQMAMFVLLTVRLFQKGSAESNDPDAPPAPPPDPAAARDPRAPWPVRRGGWVLRVYEHSLSLALGSLFLVSLCGHVAGGAALYNEERLRQGEAVMTRWEYLQSSRFWFESLQNWQSEFLAIGAMVVLTIFLRERGSPESKPVELPHGENE